MTTVTKESLAARVAELEAGPRSIKEDYQLEAYRMLLDLQERYAELLEQYDLEVNPEGK